MKPNILARFFSRAFFVAALIWFTVALTIYFLINLLIMPYFAGKFVGKVSVPALVSTTPEKAKTMLKDKSLLFMLDSTGDYSNDIPAGKILSQFPLEGTEVKKGRRIWVRISKGLKSVELPALRGLSLRQAEITLQQLGLKMGRVREIRGSNIPVGAVIGTIPKANSVLGKGHVVEIELSQGADALSPTMPKVVGLTLAEAKDVLKNQGLSMGKITQEKEKKTLPGTVLSQIPAAGAAKNGKPVDLVVSK